MNGKRILMAKLGLDGHDRGVKVVARALRDAGFEVIYTGLRHSPEQVAESALQEDPALIGVSILSGAHMALIPRLMEEMKKRNISGIPIFLGGIIPDEDREELVKMGVRHIYGPGSTTKEIISGVEELSAGRTPA